MTALLKDLIRQQALRLYLRARSESVEAFALRAGVSAVHVYRLLSAKGEFSTKALRAIADATNGEVSVASLVASLERIKAAASADQQTVNEIFEKDAKS